MTNEVLESVNSWSTKRHISSRELSRIEIYEFTSRRFEVTLAVTSIPKMTLEDLLKK